MPSLAELAYDTLGAVVSVAGAPLLPLLALTPYGEGMAERLGRTGAEMFAAVAQRPVWIHAASMGEVLAAEPLVATLRERRPSLPIVMSTTSLTGRAAAGAVAGVDGAMLAPLDLRWVVARVLAAVAPRVLIITETEIWPALIWAAHRRGVPVLVVSGCISEPAARRYGWVRPVVRAVLGCVSAFGMQTAADADRVIGLGAPPDRVHVTGSLKYARQGVTEAGQQTPPVAGIAGRPLLVAASTQPGEEAVVLDACRMLWRDHPDCLLVLAPRRPERFVDVDHLLRAAGVPRQRRTELAGHAVAPDTKVLLLDTMGELAGWLGFARAAFVGGTLADLGGHNVLEPAAAGTAVCFGPHTENVAEAASALLAAGGAARVHDAEELAAVVRPLVADPTTARAMGRRAQRVVQERATVIEDTFRLVAEVLP